MNDIGQMIMTGLSSTVLSVEEKDFLTEENIGGVLLFAHNFESPAQLAELVNSIQACRTEYPLFIAVDNEGGRVFRFKNTFSQIPNAYAISRLNSPKICFHLAKIMADELASCGVNLNLAPVCDIWNNPKNKVIGDRAFGKDLEQVSKHISSVIRGFQTNNILACAKHFPGHGSTLKDSHHDLPIIKKTMEELEGEELVAFEKAIKSRVEFVMMGHLLVDAIDDKLPTSLSKKAYDLLREKLRFNKIIITDDMEMEAITKEYSVEQAAIMSIEAGANIVEYRSMEMAKLALEGLKEAKKMQKLKNSIIAERVSLINDCKKKYLKEYKPIYIPELSSIFGLEANRIFIDEVREKIEQLPPEL